MHGRVLGIIGLVTLGLADGCATTRHDEELEPEAPMRVDPDVAIATICRDPATRAETGRYIFAVMNDMLRRCPGITPILHFDRVKTCKQAQAFSAAWPTYEKSHPENECEPPRDYNVVTFVEEGKARS